MDLIVHIVDDDEAAAASLKALMTSIGFPAAVYHSADAFLAKYDESMRGLLLLDVRLPGMDGIELQKLLNARGSQLPVIMLSGHADENLANEALADGAVAFLAKPTSGERIRQIVTEVANGVR